MGLPVNAQIFPIPVKDRHRVEHPRPVRFIKAHGNHRAQLFCHSGKMPHRVIFFRRFCKPVIFVPPLLAEIGPLKKFREQNHLGPLPRSLPYQFLRPADIFLRLFAAPHLDSPHRYLSHTQSTSLFFLFPGVCLTIYSRKPHARSHILRGCPGICWVMQ